jgi:hypothetical protein
VALTVGVPVVRLVVVGLALPVWVLGVLGLLGIVALLGDDGVLGVTGVGVEVLEQGTAI